MPISLTSCSKSLVISCAFLISFWNLSPICISAPPFCQGAQALLVVAGGDELLIVTPIQGTLPQNLQESLSGKNRKTTRLSWVPVMTRLAFSLEEREQSVSTGDSKVESSFAGLTLGANAGFDGRGEDFYTNPRASIPR